MAMARKGHTASTAAVAAAAVAFAAAAAGPAVSAGARPQQPRAAAGLAEAEIAGTAASMRLDGAWAWTASSASLGVSVPAAVPGDVITDLQRAGVVPDPMFALNWRDPRVVSAWNRTDWELTTTFPADAARAMLLVLDGVKMAASVRVNGVEVVMARDQFLRYVVPLPAAVLRRGAPSAAGGGGGFTGSGQGASGPTNHTLEVRFDAAVADVAMRYSACTGGYDWAPYSTTMLESDAFGGRRSPTFSFGLWRGVHVVEADPVALTDLVVTTAYRGAAPVAPLRRGEHAGFEVRVGIHVLVTGASTVAGTLTVRGNWSASAVNATIGALTLAPGEHTLNLTLQADAADTELWWPCTHAPGPQPLYAVTATFATNASSRKPARAARAHMVPSSSSSSRPAATVEPEHELPQATSVTSTRAVGFRVVHVVTVNDTDTAARANASGADGTGDFGRFWRVNGAAVFVRGANKVPMEELEGRATARAVRRLVASACDAGFNTLRVWGGGVFESAAFYDACDVAGLMLLHDFMFAGALQPATAPPEVDGGHFPPFGNATAMAVLDDELRHQARRLAHHPSVAVWAGCNGDGRCEQNGAVNHVMTVVASEDASRPVLPASPSNAWATGVDRLTGLPNGKPLMARGAVAVNHETCGPYEGLGANGWFSHNTWAPVGINSAPLVLFAPTTLPAVPAVAPSLPSDGGWPANHARFVTEFGCVGWSSFESYSATVPPSDWSLHSNASFYRNWPVDSIVKSYFGVSQNLSETGEAALKRQLYQSMIAQALYVKAAIEEQRASGVMGSVIWMFNEIWPTGGWGAIEYGCASCAGQVEGGRWKPLMHTLQQVAFQDNAATCGPDGRCVLFNDAAWHVTARVEGTVVATAAGNKTVLFNTMLAVPAGAGASSRWCALGAGPPAPGFVPHPNTVPINRQGYNRVLTGATVEACESACGGSAGPCAGFTMLGSDCWLYPHVNGTTPDPAATWYERVANGNGPAPPQPPNPSDEPCLPFSARLAGGDFGCGANGAKCVLMLRVTILEPSGAGGQQPVENVLLFVPPKALVLPNAIVTATVGAARSPSADERGGWGIDGAGTSVVVPVTLSASATALYVTLTTAVAGRFSENAVLLRARGARVVNFLCWNETLTGAALSAALRATLRVEHLQMYA